MSELYRDRVTWRCPQCGEERPDEFIGVHKVDRSDKHGLPPGTLIENRKYCLDKTGCWELARSPEGRV